VQTHRTEEEQAKLIDGLRTWRPELKARIDKTISDLLGLFAEYDPLDLLTPSIVLTVVGDPSTYKDSEQRGRGMLDYLLSLAFSQPYPTSPKPTTPDAVQRIFDLVEELHGDLPLYYTTEGAEDVRPKIEAKMRLKTIMRTIWVRGDDYWTHRRLIYDGLFSGVDSFFVDKYGFTSGDILRVCEDGEAQLTGKLKKMVEGRTRAISAYRKCFEKCLDRTDMTRFSSDDEVRSAFHSEYPPEEHLDQERMRRDAINFGGKKLLEIVPSDDRARSVCDVISLSYGDNAPFLEDIRGSRGWPLHSTLVHQKPVLLHDGRHYLPNGPDFSWSLRSVAESLIHQADPKFYERRYLPNRDKYLEGKVTEVMRSWFGDDNVYSNLHYNAHVGGEETDCELDCLVTYGDAILVVEAKAGGLARPARRGGLARLRDELEKLVAKAHEQATRALDYIASRERAPFRSARGDIALTVERSTVRQAIAINVTLEQLGPLVAHLPSLRDLGVLESKTWPWSVSLGDLLVFRDIIERPGVFLHYLHQRIQLNQRAVFECDDELALMMLYMKRRLWFTDSDFKGLDTYDWSPETDELDRYYMCSEAGLPATKPEVTLPQGLEEIVRAIEENPSRSGTTVLCAILDCDDETRNEIGEHAIRMSAETEADGRPHNAVMIFDKGNGHAILAAASPGPYEEEWLKKCAEKYFREQSVSTVYCVTWVPPLGSPSTRTHVFEKQRAQE